ncbi:hypothetical protein BJ878DRAFT_522934 [Calycina marina]|uniref:Uncharacterized protein n=1 Tax=Calycina marina TaxID=1763456 RepID=A0A9P7YVY9_9HELO|nr:hypothetical protein BJ878DRAFT_522934 [Calycina marina]
MASSSRPPPQGRDRRDSLASVDRLVQQHRTLVTTLAGNMTHQQLMNLVIEGACDDEANGILFNRLIKASNEARGISQYPSPSPAAQPSSATPTNPDAHTNGGSHNHRRSESSRHRSERSSSLNGTTVASNASRRHSNDFADDMAISDDEDIPAEVPRKMTATQLDRFRAREKRGDQWITSSKAYLIPEGRTPPKKGPVPVGVAKKRKNVVTAGFDYRMRFHYRMTKHDREGNLVSKEGHTPAIRREQVDFHPTLANLSEECFFREVLRRQLDHEARGVAY